ncbi:MAG TPA: flagellar export chaperone FliS [Nitrospinaceae bacterium]|nr:flagellar export chaperone FliS [Nitrospinaceae bacterium]HIL27348.1 flagellar export chaperone FliS [Nitrospinaceae bacterium]
MFPHRLHNEYRHNEVATSSQGKLIIMMYEGALKCTTLALEGIDSKDLVKKGTYINKTHDIINELSCALDIEKGGDVARKLESLYQFILHQLTLANVKSDRKALESIVNVLTTLMGAWKEILDDKVNNQTDNGQKNGATHSHKKITSRC